MAGPRLPFLWPMLAKGGLEISNPALRSAKAAGRIRALHSTPKRRQADAPSQRYGTANQPPDHLGGGKVVPVTPKPTEQAKALPKIGEKLQHDGEVENGQAEKNPTTVDENATVKSAGKSSGSLNAASSEKPVESLLETIPEQQSKDQQSTTSSSSTDKPNPTPKVDDHAPPVKPPHMDTPRHVHHFDSYSLVQQLEDSGWTEDQAITVMKAMRLMLSENIDLAREALVSKSQVENETYLFRAACAELKTEVTSRRKSEQEKMRTERTQLQHEMEILNQKLGQESAAMKDELRGMFDDRKMAVRNEQRNTESKVQKLNYQITVDLQADAKSEVEGLRWVMTRRVIIALGSVIFMVVGSLKLASSVIQDQEAEAKRRGKMRSGGTQTDGGPGGGGGGGGNGGYRDSGNQGLSPGDVFIKESGENPALITLG
ncbi:uncharacterized protein RCC_04661 [Ramularia collo-cygni]|uniref:MOZ protein represents a chromatin-associated acetyltransferase n=1 Tax=Ramularia collo-cygni TaxID=112498 RepID=A0A2D3V2A8_9PEZI|nr:uncharacterized protein RCC_04661 [Ramularia collo-cygni]CZT18817.1 uncharacterized protein RCC_04661 [Ramularia collo-cygni]